MYIKRFDEYINENRVYHGSPYEFNYFSQNMIGQGEGASGWGYGFYFSEDKDDAKEYARKLEREKGNGRVYSAIIPEYMYFLDLDKYMEDQSDYVKQCIIAIPDLDKKKLLTQEENEFYIKYEQEVINGEYDFDIDSDEYKNSVKEYLLNDIMSGIGSDFYNSVKQNIGDGYEYEASEYLYRYGIKGNTHVGFRIRHYVVFSEEDIQITRRTKSLKMKY